LRAQKGEGGPIYTRRPEIEASIREALALPRETLLERALIKRRDAEGYLASEVLVHLLRNTKRQNTTFLFDRLYNILLKRIEILCGSGRESFTGKQQESAISVRLRESVIDAVVLLISKDRESYSPKLDYLEVSFDQYIARRKADARRSIRRREGRTDQIEPPSADGYVDPAIEKALSNVKGAGLSESDSLNARIDLAEAIAQLPEKERTVIILKMQDMPIQSDKEGVDSMSSVLGCDPKTVRNRLKRAHGRLQELLDWGDS
jgi:RNA polymerase sigma factor (sigma-70 family)